MGRSWHRRVSLSAQSALRDTNPQSGIEGIIRFEGWYKRQTATVEVEPQMNLVSAPMRHAGPEDLRKPALVIRQMKGWSLWVGRLEQRYLETLTGSKGENRPLSPYRNPSPWGGSRSGRAWTSGKREPELLPTGQQPQASESRIFSPCAQSNPNPYIQHARPERCFR
jgi:hypothetical protein